MIGVVPRQRAPLLQKEETPLTRQVGVAPSRARTRTAPQKREQTRETRTRTNNQETKARKPRFKTSEETMKDSDAKGDRLCSKGAKRITSNDPSAGSPTETLLRLLLPLNDKVWTASLDIPIGEPLKLSKSGGLTGSFNR